MYAILESWASHSNIDDDDDICLIFRSKSLETHTKQNRRLEARIEGFSKPNSREYNRSPATTDAAKNPRAQTSASFDWSPANKAEFLELWRPWSLELGCPVVLWKQVQQALWTEEAGTYIVEGSREAASHLATGTSSDFRVFWCQPRAPWVRVGPTLCIFSECSQNFLPPCKNFARKCLFSGLPYP